jgi:hypothetical protein
MPEDQRMAALARGNAVRAARKRLRQEVERGNLNALEVIRGRVPNEWEEVARTYRIRLALQLKRGVGPTTVREVCKHLGLVEDHRLGTLSYSMRADLAETVRRLLEADGALIERAPARRDDDPRVLR